MILDYLSNLSPEKFQPSYSDVAGFEFPERPVNTSVDWLRVTNPSLGKFDSYVKKFLPLLLGIGFKFVESGGGLNGYTNAWSIQFNGENCGHIAADRNNKMGGMIEFSGKACQLLQVRWDMFCFLVAGLKEFDFAVKRLDAALDFKGAVWDEFNFNMTDFARAYKDGMFVIGSGSGAEPTHSTHGDWLDLFMSDGSYDPRSQCPSGLTLSIGKSTSGNSWCIYEKGKQLAGLNPDRYDGTLGSWVRVERRFSTGSGRSKRVIPFDFVLLPDEAIVYGCDGFESFVNKWVGFQSDAGVEVVTVPKVGIDVDRVGLSKSVSIKKTVRHAARQCGRVFKTLEDIGVNIQEFIDLAKKDEGVKGFSPDIYDAFSVSPANDIMSFLRGELCTE